MVQLNNQLIKSPEFLNIGKAEEDEFEEQLKEEEDAMLSPEEKDQQMRAQERDIIRAKYKVARRVDYILTILIFLLSTIGTLVVIVLAAYA